MDERSIADPFLEELRRIVEDNRLPLEADPELVETENTARIRAKIEYAWGKRYPFAVVSGPAGVGKTLTLKKLAHQLGQIYIRAYPGYSAPAMVQDIARHLKITQVQQFRVLIGVVLDALSLSPRLIVLDDVENIPRETLGVAKYLADESGSTFVICTMDEYLPQIRRYRDIDSRIGVIAQTGPVSARELVRIYQDSGFTKETLQEIHSITGGIMRDVIRLVRYFDEGLERLSRPRKDLTPEQARRGATFLHFTGGR
jgi:DNA transposition AAA+ family ATPase